MQAPTLYVDAGYVTDDTLAEAREAGRKLIGPARPPGNPGKKNLFDSNAFDVRISERKATCPAGKTQSKCSRLVHPETGAVNYRFDWSTKCDGCPLRDECTTSPYGRRLLVGAYHDDLQQRRREMKTDTFKTQMQKRNGIEGTISEFVRSGGRQTRYWGKPKTALGNYMIGAAVNAKRWIRLEQYQIEQREKAA